MAPRRSFASQLYRAFRLSTDSVTQMLMGTPPHLKQSSEPDPNGMFTDDAKLIDALVRAQRAESAGTLAEAAGVDSTYAAEALARMADYVPDGPDDSGYPLVRRPDLGPDVYEAL